MARKKTVLVAYLKDGDAERDVVVEILNFDRIKAEKMGPSMGLPVQTDGANLQYASLYLFFALTRVGEYTGKWGQFSEEDLLDFDPVDDEDAEELDPTRPAQLTEPRSSSRGISAVESISG